MCLSCYSRWWRCLRDRTGGVLLTACPASLTSVLITKWSLAFSGASCSRLHPGGLREADPTPVTELFQGYSHLLCLWLSEARTCDPTQAKVIPGSIFLGLGDGAQAMPSLFPREKVQKWPRFSWWTGTKRSDGNKTKPWPCWVEQSWKETSRAPIFRVLNQSLLPPTLPPPFQVHETTHRVPS